MPHRDPTEITLANLIYLRRAGNGITAGTRQRIDALFADIVSEYIRQLDGRTPSRVRIMRFVRDVNGLAGESFEEIHRAVRGELARLGVQESTVAIEIMQASRAPALLQGLAFERLTLSRVKAIIDLETVQGDTLRGWFRSLRGNTALRVQRQVQIGLAQGDTRDAIIDRLIGRRAGRRRVGGVAQTTYRGAETLVRTTVTHVSAQAQRETFAAQPDITEEYIYSAILDARTSEICAALDGRRFRFDDPKALYPPQHPNCRSAIQPVVIDVEIERRSMEEWLRSQPAETADRILGPARAKLWRAGKITLHDLVNSDGRLLRLDELGAAA